MNLAVVRGVAHAVGTHVGRGAVVIGFDGRHGSRAFAEESASVLGGLGLEVWLFDEVCPTPELSFAVRELGAAAGVMVTGVAQPARRQRLQGVRRHGLPDPPARGRGDRRRLGGAAPSACGPGTSTTCVREAWFAACPRAVGERWMEGLLALRTHPEGSPLTIVYTAMHGVGTRRVQQLLERAGHTGLVLVEAQCSPDPDFPTVHFPNPEEPGAMDMALDAARAHGADLVLANDPDADRLCVGRSRRRWLAHAERRRDRVAALRRPAGPRQRRPTDGRDHHRLQRHAPADHRSPRRRLPPRPSPASSGWAESPSPGSRTADASSSATRSHSATWRAP